MTHFASYWHEPTRISIMAPVGWEVEDIEPTAFRFYSPPDEANDDYRSSISYALHAPEGGTAAWLTEFAAASRDNMAATYNGFRLLNESRVMSSDFADVALRWYEWNDEATGLAFSQVQGLILADPQSIYLADAATLQGTADVYIPIFDSIIASTRIIPRRWSGAGATRDSW